MPGRTKRPCMRPGCGALVASGYCEKCKPRSIAAASEKERPTAAARLYNWRWQKARKAWLGKPEHAKCVDPFNRHVGVVKSATHIDHIIAHKGDVALFWDEGNWQPLCWGCNSYKAAKEEGGFGNRKARG